MDLVNSDEAAKMLGVTKGHLHSMSRRGYIRVHRKGASNWYDPHEIFDLKEIKKSNLTVAEAASRATRAEMAVRRLERKVDMLMSCIGADIPSVDLDPEAVVALHLKAQDALETTRAPSVDDVMYWSRTFQSLHEEYFHVVGRQFLTDKPWARYYNLSNKFLREKPAKKIEEGDVQLKVAYGCMDIAISNLRRVMWFYVCTTAGKRRADRRFPEALSDTHEDIMHLATVMPR